MIPGIRESVLRAPALAVSLLSTLVFESTSIAAPESSDHWAFQPVRQSAVPTAAGAPASPVDAFILARLRRESLRPPAGKHALLRRATYDLTGLPPTPAQVDSFLADDSPDAFSCVVERLLASPHYGEHWGRKWLDVVRYADTAGENTDHPLPHAWRYRNWVIKAFNSDKPYDEFIREQIAGDLLAAAGPPDQFADHITATGFLAIARRFGHDIDKDMHLTFEDTIDTLGKSVLGLTLGCARCHDHKNDPVTTRDYYGLYGIFESTRFSFPGCEPKQQPRDLVPIWSAGEIAARRRPFEEQLAAFDAKISQLADAQTETLRTLDRLAGNSTTVLAEGRFNDGGAQPISTGDSPIMVNVRAGEMIRLGVLPQSNHGADTTIVEFEVEELDGGKRRWNLAVDVAGDFLAGNPHADRHANAAVWCFLDARQGWRLLPHAVRDHEGRRGLHIWRNGENPSVFVNSTDQPIKAWTTLPARTLFVHPAPDGPVAVAWLSPVTGRVRLTGRVADGHPGGGDGVAWRLDHHAADFAAGISEMAAVAHNLREPVRRRAELKALEPKIPVAYAVTEGSPRNSRVQQRGDPGEPGTEVPRKFLEVLGGQTVAMTNQSGRLELAGWLTDPSNPLTARVMVNRIWQGHFVRGLVMTPNDFGRQGRPPTHPELLDWLAGEFVRSGWSVKAMHRLMMASAAYQQSAAENIVNDDFDIRRRRLTAEELRDTLLAATEELDLTPGEAHPFPPPETWNFTQHGPFADDYETFKRSVYVMQKRNRRTSFFALFDGPDPNASTATRDVTTVPTQALYFMNDPFVHARAETFAARIIESAPDDRSRLDFACRRVFGRPASAGEQADVAGFLRGYAAMCADQPPEKRTGLAWSAYARILFGSNELLYVD